MLVRVVELKGPRQVAVCVALMSIPYLTNFNINARLDGLGITFVEEVG